MTERRQKTTPLRRFFHSRLFVIVGFVVVLITAFGYARAYYQDYTFRQEVAALEEEVRSLEAKKLESLEILKYVTSDAFVEEVARTELNMKKPGENVLVIQRDGQVRPTIERGADENDQHLSNPRKWWYYFTHQPLPDGQPT